MRRLAIFITILMTWVNGKIIFPDEYEKMRTSYLSTQARNITTFPQKTYPQLSNRPINTLNNRPLNSDSTFYPSSNNAPSNTFSTAPINNLQPVDHEVLYWTNHVNNILAKGTTRFTLNMDRAIYRSIGSPQPGYRPNIVFSPLNLVSTLAMVLLGSAGITFNQVAKILGFESGVDIRSHSEIVHHMLGLIFKSIDADPNFPGLQVTMASGIFVQDGFPIREEFRSISQQAYENEVINVDFARKPTQATQIINDWVKERTHDKISRILDRTVDLDTNVIIASALYFNGEWNQYFYPKSTTRKLFSVTPTESVMVDMMYNGGTFPFYEDRQLGVKILGLPYKGYEKRAKNGLPVRQQAMMYVLLPLARDAEALNSLENRLTAENLESIIDNMQNESCVIGFPKMKLSSTLNLNRALESLGLTSLFDPSAANLGLLSPGYNEIPTSRQPSIFTRFGGEDDGVKTTKPKNDVTGSTNRATKNNFFRYEDKKGGFNVEQWDTGVLIEKIPSSDRYKRSEDENPNAEEATTEKLTKMEKESYERPIESANRTKVRFVDIGNDKYKFDRTARTKRQLRPMDAAFVRFFKSRSLFPNYGIDDLRNSRNIVNPGLFASDVFHKVEMDITETGTVAAAATAVTIQRGGDIKRFVADRPFLFFIRHEPSKLILFWGAVNKPTPNY